MTKATENSNVICQAIIKSTITKCLLEEQEETEERNALLHIIYKKLVEEYALTNHRQSPGKNGFEETERLMLSNIEVMNNALSTIDDLFLMATVVNQKALHEFILQKCKEQTMTFTKIFELRGNSPQINKLRQELTTVVNQRELHEFDLQKCKEQTMTFTKKFKLRGNSPKLINLGEN